MSLTGQEMMTSVWKYPLSDHAAQTIMLMPNGLEFLRVALQDGTPTIWARVYPDAPKVSRTFQIFGTGHPVPPDATYIGTFDRGTFVWHVFEVRS